MVHFPSFVDVHKFSTTRYGSTNWVTNPGYESSENWSGVPDASYPGTSFYRTTWGTAAPNSGSYGYAISNHVLGDLRSEPIAAAGGAAYDLYAFVRGEHDPYDSHGGWRLRVNYYDATGAHLSPQDAHVGTVEGLNTSWGYKGGRITTPANAACLRIRLYTYQNTGWIAFDDISLTTVSDYQTTTLSYNVENRLVSTSGAVTASFIYNGDGYRVKSVVGGATMVTIGDYFEWTGSASTMKSYYYAGGARVAVRTGSSLNWIVGDHLGSTSVVTDANGANAETRLYKPWGEQRYPGGMQPGFGFTGQRGEPALGLYDYKARWYDVSLGRFIQADTIVPGAGNPSAWDMYAYTLNNPVRFSDPSGHCPICFLVAGIILIGASVVASVDQIHTGSEQMQWASQQPTFAQEQAVVQQWQDNCMGQCHYAQAAAPIPGMTAGGPRPETPVTDVYSEGAANLAQGAMGLVGSAAGLYKVGAALAPSLGTARMQALTNAANSRLSAEPALANTVLRQAEYAAGQNSARVASMQYGNAVERMVAQDIQTSPIDRSFFHYVGGPSNPDFIGRGLLRGMNFDITTPRQVTAHLLRPYGPGLNIITYSRPPWFITFPQ